MAQTIAERHGEASIVISSAAARISREVPSLRQVRTFAGTSNYGTVRMSEGLADPVCVSFVDSQDHLRIGAGQAVRV